MASLAAAAAAAAAAKSLQLCLTLCDPTDGSPPGPAVPGILQARTLEWVAISFSNAWKWKVKGKSLSRVQLLATPWTAAYQAPPSLISSELENALLLLLLFMSDSLWSHGPFVTPWTAGRQTPLSSTVSQSLYRECIALYGKI